MADNDVLTTLRRYMAESGADEQIDLRALQCVGLAEGAARILRVWFNDGRIRDWDAREFLAGCSGRVARLADAETFRKSATVWDGAPGFDLGEAHAPADCIDFDPYEIWVASKDVTRQVLTREAAGESYAYSTRQDSIFAAEAVASYSEGL